MLLHCDDTLCAANMREMDLHDLWLFSSLLIFLNAGLQFIDTICNHEPVAYLVVAAPSYQAAVYMHTAPECTSVTCMHGVKLLYTPLQLPLEGRH